MVYSTSIENRRPGVSCKSQEFRWSVNARAETKAIFHHHKSSVCVPSNSATTTMMKLTLAALVAFQLATSVLGMGERTPVTEHELKNNPKLREIHDRLLDQSSSSSGSYNGDAYGFNFYTDSSDAYYDGYQQAWRYLGWYVSCGTPSDRYNNNGSGSHGGSGEQNQWQGNNYCQRYLMWAGVSRFHSYHNNPRRACIHVCF